MISIILPVYNNEKTIKLVLESLSREITPQDEIIVIDDCSTDKSYLKIKYFKKKYKNIQLINLKNDKQMGIAYSLNKAILISKNNYIARVDGDDINIKNRFKFQLKVLKDNPEIDLLSCSKIDYKDLNQLNIKNFFIKKGVKYNLDKITKYHLAYKNLIVHPSIICKSKILKNFKYTENYTKSQDYKLWLDMILSGIKIYSCDIPVIFYFTRKSDKSKIKLQLLYSIKARLSHINFKKPLISLILFLGSARDTISITKIYLKNKDGI